MSTSTTKKTTRPQAFTLIELLVVISIIAILASLAFPAINGAMDSAKKTTAKNAAVQIANAVVAYETEYGRLPLTNSTTVSKALMDILTGINTASDANPRGIVFIEATEWRKGKGGTNAQGFCDPWTNGVAFRIALDGDYNNTITAGTNNQPLRKKVGVWNDPGAANSRRYVNSWD
jgi:prepilin-type N-terminal cleavage/methylation domain-containing protein